MVEPGDSAEQRQTEPLMLEWLATRLGTTLLPQKFLLGGGLWVEVDGVSADGKILCEAWAHQGVPIGAQKNKVMSDAMKMAMIKNHFSEIERLIFLFADPEASRTFEQDSWRALALAEFGIQVMVAHIDESQRAVVRAAQLRQYR